MFDSDQELDEFPADLNADRQRPVHDAAVVTLLTETRDDMKWLRRAVRALFEHYGIRVDC
jgi:hypothetical protein